MVNGDINNVAMITPNKKITAKKIAPPIDDPRNDLLKAIRDGNFGNSVNWKRYIDDKCLLTGIKLRKVEKGEQKEIERSSALHDVASILARRVAIELSESEDSESDDDSEGWVEPNETSAWLEIDAVQKLKRN